MIPGDFGINRAKVWNRGSRFECKTGLQSRPDVNLFNDQLERNVAELATPVALLGRSDRNTFRAEKFRAEKVVTIFLPNMFLP